ncbi:ice-binding family protein [Janthinobacterium sp.]|uniref:ice-binding family protein n=1 Tax=Janthinobacterium sp. TaxID=1871054 RepID=UPI00293D3CC8|nr:ice-binding family protein [Janthinobacterium sp.]
MFGKGLNSVSVFSNTYATTGANSTVFGSVLSGGVATTGAHSAVSGDIVSVGATTTGGGGSSVGGSIINGGVATTGDGSIIGGGVTSVGAATIGANSRVGGNLVSAGVATTGDTSRVAGSVKSGGAASIGANAVVGGLVEAVGAISVSASGKAGGTGSLSAAPLTVGVRTDVLTESQQISEAQKTLKSMGAGTALATTMTTDMTLYAGVFSAANLSTTAGTTLTLDGQNKGNQSWVFNIEDYLVTGASTRIVLINAGAGDSVVWNSGGYSSLGASSSFLGTILARDYISVGANTSVTGAGVSCGGVFSATSYVSTGDSAQIGGGGCLGIDNFTPPAGPGWPTLPSVPEPSSYLTLLTGLAFLGLLLRGKKRQPASA